MEQLLDFEKNKTQSLTFDQLKVTYKENDVYGNPLRGIYHYELINTIIQLCSMRNYDASLFDLFAAQNKDKLAPGVVLLPQVEEQYGERAINAHILRRVYANIKLTDFDDDENTTAIAIAFHQKGIQVGFGNMVRVCHNLCMLGAEQYVSTYSEKGYGRGNGVDIDTLLKTVAMWLETAQQRVIDERFKIERMKNFRINANEVFKIIGMLTAIRVKYDTKDAKIRDNKFIYPLNQAQIAVFTEQLLKNYDLNNEITLWDVYNTATNLYKAESMEIPNIIPQNRAFVKFLNDTYNII